MKKLEITYKDLFDKTFVQQLKAQYLKEYRNNELQMSIAEVEQEFGVDRGYLSRMENAKVNPKIYWE